MGKKKPLVMLWLPGLLPGQCWLCEGLAAGVKVWCLALERAVAAPACPAHATVLALAA